MSFLERFFADEHQVLDARVRETLPGETARLSDGVTYYQQAGPRNGRPVILIHGFSVPQFIWDANFEALAAAGLRVVRYDLFGRGYSDRPGLPYDKALFVRQLAELMDVLKLPQADLVALSMGGPVAAEFAFRFPKRVRRLAFIAPAGFDLRLPAAVRWLRLPLLGELALGMLGRFGQRSLLEGMLADFYQPSQEALDYFVPRYQEQMKYHGFKRALLSSLRRGMLDEDLELYRRLGEAEAPVLLLWGEHDQTVPFSHHGTFQQLVPRAEFHAISEAGHLPHFERPDLVNPLLIEFLTRPPAPPVIARSTRGDA
ncbi:MAG: alpha/beta fold hydrolase [Anaerolineales bacterium]|nr:alpha/beta fold hydrolase [Anaerolineales bacterium]